MPEREPQRPNYAELDKVHKETQQREQEYEAAPKPPRPDVINRSVSWPDHGGRPAQEAAAIKQFQLNSQQLNENREWKRMASDPEYAQQKQKELEQQRTAQRENDGPEHDQTAGRKR